MRTTANEAGGMLSASPATTTPSAELMSTWPPPAPSDSRCGRGPRLAAIRSRPRRTSSQRPASSELASTRLRSGWVSSGCWRRSPISVRYQASMSRWRCWSRSAQFSRERSKVASSCGSGTSPSQPCRANSARRPVATARPSPASGWSVKYCQGVSAPHSSPMKQHRRERRRQDQAGAHLEQVRRHGGGDPVAGGAIADLVVVLEVADEPMRGHAEHVHRAAVRPAAE